MTLDLFRPEKEQRIGYLCVLDSGYAYGGLVVTEGKVIEAAPIFGYMVGWEFKRAADYARKKGWKIRHQERPRAQLRKETP